MLITVEHKTAETFELEMPAYYEHGNTKYKILNSDSAIEVEEYFASFGIRQADCLSGCLAMAVKEGKRITEKQFLEAFERVGEKVKRELIKAIESDGWKAQEQAELQAGALAEVEDDPQIDPVDYNQRESFREEMDNLRRLK